MLPSHTPPPQILDRNKYLLAALGSGMWPCMVLLSEIVQTFILADFWCALFIFYSEGPRT
jgi:ER lumen protein retaining receptor